MFTKGFLHLDTNIENVITRQHTTFCFCEGEMHKDCIRDHFGPIFPGQTIPISLKQIPPADHESDSFTAVHAKSFTIFWKPIAYAQCSLMLPYESKWIQVISQQCTQLSYTVYSVVNDFTS